ncbi:glycosyltransferase family 1 protein [Corynebacterium liangguodongii]|uniref:Glycosyltransferase family 1 protein n=2 Tax=Corynebacterium liangguodongii TaxID=2079535 RepID=A0A2S0WHB7_9CORY|nr:glycosyltransferase family 1 protein [Corynebacterium liangguodongii]PWB98907.1 glycosyltransferase family 1 protein [Corynebacterium liangguodongii]
MHHLIVGPAGHGVTAYAERLAREVGAEVIREEEYGDSALPPGPIHVAFTDHLFGSSPREALEALLGRVGTRPLSVSFHDVPQRAEGERRFERRAAAYAALAAAAELAVVNSEHEARFFAARAPGAAVRVIRLPVEPIDSPFDPEPATVGVVGFIYPGKGHEDLIEALAGTEYRLRFLGGVSAGHERWARSLERHAEITGWLSDDELAREMGRIAVPVCAHRHYSASGSLMTWLGAGRCVLASDSPYTREIDAWMPGRISLVEPGSWREAVSTYRPRRVAPPVHGWDAVGAMWQREWAACGLM